MDRPFVLINMAMTVDGKITSARRDYPRLTSRYDRTNMDRLRAEADALLVGAGTIRADNPLLHVRDEGMQRHREELGKPPGPHRVVVTRSGRLDPASRFFDPAGGGERIVATVEETPDAALAPLGGRAEIWRIGRGRVDLVELLRRLAARGAGRLLAEGGGELNWDLLRDDLVDELHVTVAPSLLGGREAPTLLEGQGLTMKSRRRLKLLDVHREGDELYLRYGLVR